MNESRKALRSSRTFRKLMISYFCFFLIPFVVLCATILFLVDHYSDQETTTAHAQWVTLMMEDLERFAKPMTDIQMTLQYDSSIQSSYSPAWYTPSKQLLEKLTSLKYASSDFRNLWYVPASSDYLYSDSGTLAISSMLSWRYEGLPYDKDAFLEAAEQGKLPKVMKARDLKQDDDVLLFAYPLLRTEAHSNKLHYHYVIFSIPQTCLETMLSRALASTGIRASLYMDEQLLCQTSDDAQEIYRTHAPKELTDCILVGETPVYYRHTASHSLFRAQNDQWCLEVSVQNAFSAHKTMLLGAAPLALAVLGVGFYFSFLTARNAYAPIAGIKRQSAQMVETSIEESSYNDFAVINQYLLQMSAQREKLQQEMAANTDVIENFLCYSLLYGHFDNLRNFQLPDSVRMQLTHARLRTLFLLTSQPVADVRTKLKEALEEDISFWCTSSARPVGVMVLLAYRGQQDEQVTERLHTIADSKMLIGLSNVGEDMRQIPLMALQAVFALNRQILASGRVHEYAGIPSGRQLLSVPEQSSETETGLLLQAISEQRPLETDKAYQLLGGLMRLLDENPTYASLYIACLPVFLEPLCSVQEARTADLTALGPVLEKHVRPLADEPVLFRMRRYIETHYMESEFSFKNMASDFSMSESGLSNYFKKHCGQSLMDYLTGLRIRQAINLLDNTNISIQDIGALVGYLNPNSFIRRFKQLMQMTPGEYRRSRREEG